MRLMESEVEWVGVRVKSGLEGLRREGGQADKAHRRKHARLRHDLA